LAIYVFSIYVAIALDELVPWIALFIL